MRERRRGLAAASAAPMGGSRRKPIGLTALILIINNPKSILLNGTSHRGDDPRFGVLISVARLLEQRGHTVLLEGAGALSVPAERRSERRGASQMRAFTWLSRAAVARHGRPHFAVKWFAYPKDSRPSTLALELMQSIPVLSYENGMTKGSVIVDPKGLLGASYYVSSLNERVQRQFDDDDCSRHIRKHVAHDSSKRPQTTVMDIPSGSLGQYVFVPTQKFADVSVQQYSNISYPELLRGATRFCKARERPGPASVAKASDLFCTFPIRRTGCRSSSRSTRTWLARSGRSRSTSSPSCEPATSRCMSLARQSTF